MWLDISAHDIEIRNNELYKQKEVGTRPTTCFDTAYEIVDHSWLANTLRERRRALRQGQGTPPLSSSAVEDAARYDSSLSPYLAKELLRASFQCQQNSSIDSPFVPSEVFLSEGYLDEVEIKEWDVPTVRSR